MARTIGSDTCSECRAPARVHLGDRPLCDRCFDSAISQATGWPELPEPPLPETLTGADGRKHHLRYRLRRSPGGIVAEAEEVTAAGKLKLEGYYFKLVGSHVVEVASLLDELRKTVRSEISRVYLKTQVGRRELAGGA